MSRRILSHFLGLVGAVLGGVLGFYTFEWLEKQSLYGLAIPGSFLGLGCGLLAQHRSVARGIVCAIAALGLSLFTEWWFHPFVNDRVPDAQSFTYMLRHLNDLRPATLLMIGLATVIAYWVGQDAGFQLMPWSRRQPAGTAAAKPPTTDETA